MWVKLLLIFFAFSFLFRTDLSFDQDLGRHLKLGEIITSTHQVPKINLFSYTNPDFAFINTHWLFEVMTYGFSQTIGIWWLLVLKITVILLSIFLIIKTIPKENRTLLLPIGFIFLHVLRERLELRPEIFSFLFTALTYYILEQFLVRPQVRRTTIFFLPIIQLLWINTHIYFFVGLILQVIFLLHLGYEYLRLHPKGVKLQLLSIIFTLSVIVSFINPNGLNGFLYPLNVTKNYGYTIVENQTMFLLESIHFNDPNILFAKLSIVLVGLSVLVALLSSLRKQGSINIKNILLSAGGIALALMNVRSFPYLVFLSLPATLENFGVFKWKNLSRILITVTAMVLILESIFYLDGDYYKFRTDQHEVGLNFVESGKEALDFALTRNLPSPIYNNFDIGSYIIYRGFPKYQVFVDGRPEAYPKQFFQDIYIPTQYDYQKFKDLEAKWGFKTIIFSHTDQTPWAKTFLQNLLKDTSWKLVYIDDFMLVLTKEGANIDLSKLNPSSYRFTGYLSYLRIGIFLLTSGYQDSGQQFILRAQQIFPEGPAINKFFW